MQTLDFFELVDSNSSAIPNHFVSLTNINALKTRHIHIDVVKVLGPDVWLAGGALRPIVHKSKSTVVDNTICDYDLFFKSDEAVKATISSLEAMDWVNTYTCPPRVPVFI